MPIVRTMPFSSSHNAKCAHNAICASHTMPFMHTMPIVHTMPFMESTQCQLCAQCQICSTFGIVRVHIWHCVAAYLALCDVILYMQIIVAVKDDHMYDSTHVTDPVRIKHVSTNCNSKGGGYNQLSFPLCIMT